MRMKSTLDHKEIKSRMMNYSNFMDKPGHFLGYSSYTKAVSMCCGTKGKISKMVADDMIREGHFMQAGKVYIALKK